ncbi:hypothetical protein Tco_1067914 [Tanacetum coccineum]|uniref:Uncharacterized protein n=1 Tax=Tanacetum coccineum TaxID=301880 RepID=A0ABQ5HG50_9ASTR
MQDKNMVINELKKLILVTKGKSVETQFDKPSVVRQPNAQRITKPSVLGKPTPFSNSPEMRSFQTKQSVNKTNVSDGLFKTVTQQNLPKKRNQAVRNTNVLEPGMYRIASTTNTARNTTVTSCFLGNTNPHLSKSSGVNSPYSISSPQLKVLSSGEEKVCQTVVHSEVTNDGSRSHHRMWKMWKTVASDTTNQKSKSYYKKLYEDTNQEWKWWIAKRCPSGYTWTQKPLRTKKIWMPKIRKDDVSSNISPTIDIVSRITNVLKISNFIGSNLSNIPSSSNSLADCTTHPIHC